LSFRAWLSLSSSSKVLIFTWVLVSSDKYIY
jgi:hypothetical protein